MLYNYTIKNVLKVVDGDTIDVEVDLGFDISIKRRVRIFGIDAPETRTRDKEEKARGKESKKFLKELIANSNETIYLRSYDVDKYGRVLGEIIIDGTSVSKTMIAEGHAVEYS